MIIQKNKGKVVQENGATKEKFRMVAKTMVSLEEVLADELRQMGAENVTVGARAVEFEGDMRLLYRANYCCRTALAILKPFAEFDANDDQELYDQVYRIRWEKILDVDCTFMIDSTTSGEVFTHSYYAALKTKDAIVDRFRRNFGKRPNIDTENPDYKFNLHIRDNHVTLLMNSSGDSLHKRGYRQGVGVAPINEVLAAGLLYLAGWTQAIKQSNNQAVNFYDPMCGSGTMLIEAAMMANNIPAQYYRGNRFGFMRWKEFNLGEWKSVKAEEDRKIGALDFEGEIWGNDIDEQVIQQCEKNLEYTKLHKDVMLHIGDFADQEPPEGKTLIVTNPPYGERIKVEDLNAMYEKLGDTFKKFGSRKSEVRDNADDSSNLRPSTSDLRPSTSDLRPSTSDLRPSTSDLRPPTSDLDLWLITSDFEAMKHIGLHPSRKIPVQNGSLDCRFLHFELYDGSKKASKNS